MNFIYVIHLMCWNYLIDLITDNRNRNKINSTIHCNSKGGHARSARSTVIVSVPAVVSVSAVCDQVDEGNQVVPAHQVDDINEVHELDPVHQVDHKDEQRSRPPETGPRKLVPGKPPLENRPRNTALEKLELTLNKR